MEIILDKCDADLDNCEYPCIICLDWISWDNSSQIQSEKNNLVFLDPRLIADIDENKARLKSVCRLLVQCNRVSGSEVDEILRQYSEYASTVFDKERDHFVNFDPARSRLDSLLHETLAGKESYTKIWKVIKMLPVLSHGQTSVERGFSINKQTEEIHLHWPTFLVLCYSLFLYVFFCFFSTMPREWLGKTSLKCLILYWVGRKTLTQSIPPLGSECVYLMICCT